MRALVIDDSRTMRRIVAGTLEGMGFETVQAEHGRAALDVLESGIDVQLCCIDWNMPVMDGLTFVGEVRANPEWRDITMMMVTTESEQGQIVRALAAGARATEVIDRFWFKSIYFREPSGVLFEIATLGPGFDADEDPAHLGEKLVLPPRFEPLREKIEATLTPIDNPRATS